MHPSNPHFPHPIAAFGAPSIQRPQLSRWSAGFLILSCLAMHGSLLHLSCCERPLCLVPAQQFIFPTAFFLPVLLVRLGNSGTPRARLEQHPNPSHSHQTLALSTASARLDLLLPEAFLRCCARPNQAQLPAASAFPTPLTTLPSSLTKQDNFYPFLLLRYTLAILAPDQPANDRLVPTIVHVLEWDLRAARRQPRLASPQLRPFSPTTTTTTQAPHLLADSPL